ncbi:MAG: hypothetical protein ACPL1D_02380, partial [Microgenomates group bacterium]
MTESTKNNFDCFNLPPVEYSGLVLVCCQNRRNELRTLLNNVIPEELSQKLAVIIIGSDGKEERHPQSKTELVILYQNTEDDLQKKIKLALSQLGDPTLLIEDFKNISEGTLSFYNNDPKTIYPDRILNSILVWGDVSIYTKARIKVLLEMTEDSNQGKRIREEIKKQLSAHRQTTKTGRFRNQVVFDNTYQYYFESDNPKEWRHGFKMGPLRAVQRRLDLLTIEAFKKGKLTLDEIESLPTNTVERIDFFVTHGLIDKDFAQKLIEA